MNKQAIIETAVKLLLPLVLTVMGSVTVWLGAHLKAFIAAKTKNTMIAGILTRLNDHVVQLVLEAEQAIRPQLATVAETGKLTTYAAAQLRGSVLATLKDHLGVGGIKELLDVLGINASILDSFLTTRIESAVAQLPPSTSPAPVSNPTLVTAPAAPAPAVP